VTGVPRDDAALDIRDLRIELATSDGPRAMVDGLDLQVGRGRIHGLAGESGSGKTITALAVLGLLPGTRRNRG